MNQGLLTTLMVLLLAFLSPRMWMGSCWKDLVIFLLFSHSLGVKVRPYIYLCCFRYSSSVLLWRCLFFHFSISS